MPSKTNKAKGATKPKMATTRPKGATKAKGATKPGKKK